MTVPATDTTSTVQPTTATSAATTVFQGRIWIDKQSKTTELDEKHRINNMNAKETHILIDSWHGCHAFSTNS